MEQGPLARVWRRMAVVAVGVVALLAAGCSSSAEPRASAGSPPSAAPMSAAVDGDLYHPREPIADGPDGEILAREPLAAPAGATAWRVLYRSRALDGRPIAVSGMVVEPPGTPPAGGWPVLSWAHGTTGSADRCAPSRQGVDTVPALSTLLGAGYVVAATDYEGLGTPGPHPYLVGASEGRSVLDAARAARHVVAQAGGPVVLWGHSQGGQAAVWAGELATAYAPDLPVAGVAAFAPAARLDAFLTGGSSPLVAGFEVAAMAGLAAVDSDLDVADLLVPAAVNRLDVLETGCIGDVLATFGVVPGGVLSPGASSHPQWVAALAANEAGEHRSGAPVLVLQGGADVLVRPEASALYQRRACASGSAVDLRTYPAADHGTVLTAGQHDALAWSADRVAGLPAPRGC